MANFQARSLSFKCSDATCRPTLYLKRNFGDCFSRFVYLEIFRQQFDSKYVNDSENKFVYSSEGCKVLLR